MEKQSEEARAEARRELALSCAIKYVSNLDDTIPGHVKALYVIKVAKDMEAYLMGQDKQPDEKE